MEQKRPKEAVEESFHDKPNTMAIIERARRSQGSVARPRNDYDYPSLRLLLSEKEVFRNLMKWGLTASAAELEAAAHDLVKQTDRNRILSYLSIFRRVRFPASIEKILELATSEDGRIARAATMVLAQISDPRIRDLSLRFLAAPDRRGDALELMISNYCAGDFEIINRAVQDTPGEYTLHSVGMGLRSLLKVHCPSDAVSSLLFLYENGPCSLCRSEFVERLILLKSIPEWMRAECLFDADPDTQKLVQI